MTRWVMLWEAVPILEYLLSALHPDQWGTPVRSPADLAPLHKYQLFVVGGCSWTTNSTMGRSFGPFLLLKTHFQKTKSHNWAITYDTI